MDSREILGMKMVDLLTMLFTNEKFPHDEGAKERQNEGETARGFVYSEVTRRFYHAGNVFYDELVQRLLKHHHQHTLPENGLTAAMCRAFDKETLRLEKIGNILQYLIYQAVVGEHELTLSNRIFVRDGWRYVNRGDWDHNLLFPDIRNIIYHVFERIQQIFISKCLSVDEVIMRVRASDERILGEVGDMRARAIWALADEITEASEKIVSDSDFADPQEKLRRGDPQAFEELARRFSAGKLLSMMADSCRMIFWIIMEDAIPEIAELPDTTICFDWIVVEVKDDAIKSEAVELNQFGHPARGIVKILS